MDILLMMWLVIDMVLLMILPFRKNVTKYENVMRRRTIENVKSLSVMDVLIKIFLLFLVGLIIHFFIHIISDIVIQKVYEWYRGIFIVALFPILFPWIKEKNFNIKSIWNGCLIALTSLLSLACYLIDMEDIKVISDYREIWDILLTMQVITFIAAMLEIRKESKKNYSKKISKKGIRKDLYYRTPRLILDVSNVELIRCCEKYFDEYTCRYRKIKELHTIEYVNLAGVHKELWYKKAACFMKTFGVLSIGGTIFSIYFEELYKIQLVMGLIIIFGVLIIIYKHIDMKCLYRIGIKYFYDEWGYYLTYICRDKCRDKFVGTSQMLESSKFHKYIHSFLDIVALCRAVTVSDKINGEKKICIITSNLSELFANYSDYNENQNWVMVIPLWIAALFEFNVTGKISEDAKVILMKSVNENVRAHISIFLQSFWADIERKELKDGISKYIQLFEEELYSEPV